jgi:hypothetical protein
MTLETAYRPCADDRRLCIESTHGCWIHREQVDCARYGNRGEIPPGGRMTIKTAAASPSATSP